MIQQEPRILACSLKRLPILQFSSKSLNGCYRMEDRARPQKGICPGLCCNEFNPNGPMGQTSPETTRQLMRLEMTAMVALARRLRFGHSILWGTVGVLVVRLVMAVPLAAQNLEQQPSAPANPNEALAEYQKELNANPKSSLAYFRIAEVLFSQRNYQGSANACRDALRGDGNPSWTKVWSHIQLGEIFDVTDQRERAVLEYQLAVKTGDNTRGALDKARELLQKPYEWPETH